MDIICNDCSKRNECVKKKSIEAAGYAFSYCDEYEKLNKVIKNFHSKMLHKKTHKQKSFRDYNIGSSDYSNRKIQPWDIWEEYKLDPWDADIVKRVLRKKDGDSPELDYEKIKHICDKKIDMLKNK